MNSLNKYILFEVIKYIDINETIYLFSTNIALRNILKEDKIWKIMLDKLIEENRQEKLDYKKLFKKKNYRDTFEIFYRLVLCQQNISYFNLNKYYNTVAIAYLYKIKEFHLDIPNEKLLNYLKYLNSLKKMKLGNNWENSVLKPLNLSNFNLVFENLRCLTYLEIVNCNLEHLHESIGNLQNLKQLIVSRNNIQKIPSTICNLKRLTKLNLFNNHIKKIPKNIGNLENLIDLYLNNNFIKKLPKSICNLRRLKKLQLAHNELKFLPNQMNELSSLKFLHIHDNKLEYIPSIENVHLKTLNLKNNRLKNMPDLDMNIKKIGF